MFDRERYSFQSMNQANKVSVEGVKKTMINGELLKSKLLNKIKNENMKRLPKHLNDDLESDYIKVDTNDLINQSLFSSQVNEGGPKAAKKQIVFQQSQSKQHSRRNEWDATIQSLKIEQDVFGE